MKAEKGKIVKLDYEGRFEDGKVFDTSKQAGQERPLEFILGNRMVVPGFEKAVEGMEIGEEKEFTLKPEDAYGERREELEQKVPKEMFPKEKEPKIGMTLIMGTPTGQQIPATIKKIEDKEITLDLNHPLAGKTLVFKIKILDVKDAPVEEKVEEKTEGAEEKIEKLEDLADNELAKEVKEEISEAQKK